MIKLKDFISERLTEIVEGVIEAQERVRPYGAKVSPLKKGTTRGYQTVYAARTETVEFDVQVTTSEASKTKQGIGVFVVPLGAGVHGQTDATQSSAGHIRFHVWLELPAPEKSPQEG